MIRFRSGHRLYLLSFCMIALSLLCFKLAAQPAETTFCWALLAIGALSGLLGLARDYAKRQKNAASDRVNG